VSTSPGPKSSADVGWLTAFLDTPQEHAERAEAFWCAVSGSVLSARRGAREEFATLLPGDGDAYLKAQVVVQTPPGGLHLDVHTDDVRGLAAHAERLGASASYHELGYVVCGSPGGLTFCIVEHAGGAVPSAQPWPTGSSRVDQLCLDVPPSRWDDECAFWAAFTGWPVVPSTSYDEFARLGVPSGVALKVLLQRLGEEHPVVTGHLDVAADDRDAEVARHVGLGARLVRRHDAWTVLADPAGRAYCVTGRRP